MKTLITALAFSFPLVATLSAAGEYQLSTHVLDTTRGKPGEGVEVALERKNDQGKWVMVEKKTTNQDGRINSFLELNRQGGNSGIYRFVFSLEPYFEKLGQETVFPEAVVVFRIKGDEHYHIPLVVTPYALSTYRGS